MARNNGDAQGDTEHWRPTRRTFLAGVGAAAGVGAYTGGADADRNWSASGDGRTFYVQRGADWRGRGNGRDEGKGNDGESNGRGNGSSADDGAGKYRVIDGERGAVAFTTGGTADEAFQFAFDQLSESGGTVVASADTFEFGAPATMTDNTLLTGTAGTWLVASETGSRDDPAPSDDQSNPLPTGHDLIRLRGDNVGVANVVFDGGGTQLDNQAVQADGCDGVLLANNRTVNGFQMGLSFTRCRDVTVAGNEVVGANWYGITGRSAPEGGELDRRQSRDVRVVRNAVSDIKFNNVAPYNVRNFAVYGNLVFDGGHSLIACSPSQRGAIVGNVCRDLREFAPDPGGEAGIEIEYKETHVRESVTGTPEALSHDITVTGNQVHNCPVGFLARTVPADSGNTEARRERRPYGFTVTGNAISGSSAAGIRVRSGEAGVVATNTLRGNGTHVDVADEYVDGLQQGLNATR